MLEAFFGTNGWWWLAVGLALIGAEVFFTIFVFLWPGLAAMVTGLVVLLFPDMSLKWQVVLFALLTLGFTKLGRMWVKKRGQPVSEKPLLNRRYEQAIGRSLHVTHDFIRGEGQIELDGIIWPARTIDQSNPANGTRVTISGFDGNTVLLRTE